MPPKPSGKKGAGPTATAAFPLPPRPSPEVWSPAHPQCLPSALAVCSTAVVSCVTATRPGGAPSAELACSTADHLLPRAVVIPTDEEQDFGTLAHMSAGRHHVMLVTRSGKVFGAGSHESGQLGAGPDLGGYSSKAVPVSIPRMTLLGASPSSKAAARQGVAASPLAGPAPRILAVACGAEHTAVLVLRTVREAYLEDMDLAADFTPFTEVFVCGNARQGQLASAAFPPQAIKGSAAADSVRRKAAAPAVHRLTLVPELTDCHIDRVWAAQNLTFARGVRGLHVFGSIVNIASPSPELVPPLPLPATAIETVTATDDRVYVLAAGRVFTSIIRPDQRTIASLSWAEVTAAFVPKNSYPQDASAGAPVELNAKVRVLAAGQAHAVVLWSDGAVVGLGANSFGQLGPEGGPVLVDPFVGRPQEAARAGVDAATLGGSPATTAALTPIPSVPPSSAGRKPSGAEDTRSLPAASRPVSRALVPVVPTGPPIAVNVACGTHCTVVLLSDGSTRLYGDSAVSLQPPSTL